MNEIKLNKKNQEYIENLEKIIDSISNDANDDERGEDIEYLRGEIQLARNFANEDSRHFAWAIEELHEATDESRLTLAGISDNITEAIKQMKKAEKQMLQSKEFARTVSAMVHRKLEAMGVEQ